MPTTQRPATRIEAFTDAAFAFALTMLVISFDALPSSVDELLQSMKAIPAFVASGALLMMFWHHHSTWSQRYPLSDSKTVWLTCLFVFTVMVFVYPLRLMFSGFMHWVSGGYLRASFTASSAHDLLALFTIYGIGFTLMCVIMVLLYRHAENQADTLALTASDVFDARSGRIAFLLLGATGVLSIVMCALLPLRWALMAPSVYALLGIVMPLHARRRATLKRQRFSVA